MLSIAVVVADSLEFEPERVVPKRGVVVAGVLREVLRVVDDRATNPRNVVVHVVHQRPAPHDERQVLQAGSFR